MSSARAADTFASGDFDRAVHASIARLTHGLSPMVLVGASADWLMHLSASPGKQVDLAVLAVRPLLLSHPTRSRKSDPSLKSFPQTCCARWM
jgi:hypothetical protein